MNKRSNVLRTIKYHVILRLIKFTLWWQEWFIFFDETTQVQLFFKYPTAQCNPETSKWICVFLTQFKWGWFSFNCFLTVEETGIKLIKKCIKRQKWWAWLWTGTWCTSLLSCRQPIHWYFLYSIKYKKKCTLRSLLTFLKY